MEVIKVEQLSKAYQLGQFSSGTLSNDLKRWWELTRGREDPFLKVGETNVRTEKGDSNIVWSLKDINFTVNQGETIGIIGRNGAGKSTLLKLLSQVTSPTSGSIKIKGRIASLLEVGTGFHPELSGRENIFLNGAILGMRKAEIHRKFDEIVEFSGVERYIDTPVKRYSSGMYVRLAFAVAAHLESEILIVDEVLAVGDAEFQKKCLGKMSDVSRKEGRTILFVSHNLQAVRQLCEKGICLKHGQVSLIGTSENVVSEYISGDGGGTSFDRVIDSESNCNNSFEFTRISIVDANFQPIESYFISKEYFIQIDYRVKKRGPKMKLSVVLSGIDGTTLFGTLNNLESDALDIIDPGNYQSKIKLPGNFFNNGTFTISFHTFNEYDVSISAEDILIFETIDDGVLKGNFLGGYGGYIRPKLEWKTTNQN
jgi:lipopolysaccharide transport system ATP-binding protein